MASKSIKMAITGGHLVFWVLSVFVLMLVFNTSGKIQRIDVVYVIIFHLSLIPLYYTNALLITPKLFRRRKYVLFFVSAITAIVAFTLFSELLFERYADYLFPGYYFVSTITFRDNLMVHAFYVAASTMIVISGSWFREAGQKQKIITLEKEKINAELQMLKNQVNPHFFFNTLQSLYALALKKSDDLPGMILKLSGLMRYVIYEASATRVSLIREIEFLQDYLDLQKLRINDPTTVKFETRIEDPEIKIPPLILIHFVENCFKHGLKGNTQNAFAHISLGADRELLKFRAYNNFNPAEKSDDKKMKGTGIENAIRQLELNYPGNFVLDVHDKDANFEVTLKIKLQ